VGEAKGMEGFEKRNSLIMSGVGKKLGIFQKFQVM